MASDNITIKNISKSYLTKKQTIFALDNVNLSVRRGEFVAITGDSGSGKSTLLQLIGGLDVPSQGQVLIENQDITKLQDRELSYFRNRTFGFVFQNFYLQPFLTVRQNIELPAMFDNMKPSDRAKRTIELTERLGVTDKLNRLPNELSGGQIQRVAILRAVYNNPSIILADEPTGNLDNTNATYVFELLSKLNSDFGATVILATHDEAVRKYASRVVKLQDGKLK